MSSPGGEDQSQAEILSWLDEHGVVDKDAVVPGRSRSVSGGSERKTPFDATLDLHGMKVEEALTAVVTHLERARESGMRTLLVIHGWGRGSRDGRGPVLKHEVGRQLEAFRGTAIADYRPAPVEHGGAGATVVYLR